MTIAPLSWSQLAGFRAQLRDEVAPSEPWVIHGVEWYAAQVNAGRIAPLHGTRKRRRIERLLFDHCIIPPGGRRTSMVRCSTCRHWFPAYYIHPLGAIVKTVDLTLNRPTTSPPTTTRHTTPPVTACFRANPTDDGINSPYAFDGNLLPDSRRALIHYINAVQRGKPVGQFDWYESRKHWRQRERRPNESRLAQ